MTDVGALPLVFDGHNDVLSRLLEAERAHALGASGPDRQASRQSFFERSDVGHIDLPRAREGRFGGGLFSVYVGADPLAPPPAGPILAHTDGREVRMPRPLDLGYAQRTALSEIGLLHRLQRDSEGQVRIVTTSNQLEQALSDDQLAAVIHFEGAEPIDARLDLLDAFYQMGLRSIGPVWSRPNDFGEGVPYLYPHSPDTGPGLTDRGKALVRACNELGIVVDVSHINEQGFWDIERLTRMPIVATHSNAHALTPSPRNLTDRQLDAVKASGGIVGVNFYLGFLRGGADADPAMPIQRIVEHFMYLIERMGVDHVGFGMDLDGARIPDAVHDVAGVPRVLEALKSAGCDDADLRKLAHENWVRVLDAIWR